MQVVLSFITVTVLLANIRTCVAESQYAEVNALDYPVVNNGDTRFFLSTDYNPSLVYADCINTSVSFFWASIYKLEDDFIVDALCSHYSEYPGKVGKLLINSETITDTTLRLIAKIKECAPHIRFKYWCDYGPYLNKLHAKLTLCGPNHVLFGSANWSKSIRKKNMEFMVSSKVEEVVIQSIKMFNDMWDDEHAIVDLANCTSISPSISANAERLWNM